MTGTAAAGVVVGGTEDICARSSGKAVIARSSVDAVIAGLRPDAASQPLAAASGDFRRRRPASAPAPLR